MKRIYEKGKFPIAYKRLSSDDDEWEITIDGLEIYVSRPSLRDGKRIIHIYRKVGK
jgi:hypothetical protein